MLLNGYNKPSCKPAHSYGCDALISHTPPRASAHSHVCCDGWNMCYVFMCILHNIWIVVMFNITGRIAKECRDTPRLIQQVGK